MFTTILILAITLVPWGVISERTVFMVYAFFKHVLLNIYCLYCNTNTKKIFENIQPVTAMRTGVRSAVDWVNKSNRVSTLDNGD